MIYNGNSIENYERVDFNGLRVREIKYAYKYKATPATVWKQSHDISIKFSQNSITLRVLNGELKTYMISVHVGDETISFEIDAARDYDSTQEITINEGDEYTITSGKNLVVLEQGTITFGWQVYDLNEEVKEVEVTSQQGVARTNNQYTTMATNFVMNGLAVPYDGEYYIHGSTYWTDEYGDFVQGVYTNSEGIWENAVGDFSSGNIGGSARLSRGEPSYVNATVITTYGPQDVGVSNWYAEDLVTNQWRYKSVTHTIYYLDYNVERVV